MDSPTFYCSEFFADQKVNKADPESQFLLFDQDEHNGGPSLADLDPSLELSVDLQELIDRNSQLEPSGGVDDDDVLFPELLPDTVGGSSEDGGTSPDTFNHDNNIIDIIPIAGFNNHLLMPGAVSRSTPQDEVEEVDQQHQQAACSFPVEEEEIKEEAESPSENTCTTTSTSGAGQAILIEVNGDLLATLGDLSTVSVADLCAAVASKSEDVVAESAPELTEVASSSSRRNQPKAPSSSGSSKKGGSRKRTLDRESDEYRSKRERNNVAVRKSRDKSKAKHQETEGRVQVLTEQNEQLQKKVDLLTKELTVLKGLFSNVGAVLPPEVQKYFK